MPIDNHNPQINPEITELLEAETALQSAPKRQIWGWASIFDFLRTMAVVLLAAFLIRHFLVQPFIVDGQSMQPTFQNQEYILVDKLSYQFHPPQRGEVIVFHPPGDDQDNFIKRIIGLPGERVEIRGHTIFVNGTQFTEAYTQTDTRPDTNNDTVISRLLGQNEYYVLGDNRDHSKDSRELGAIGRDRFIGRAWLVLLPIKDLTLVARPVYPTVANLPTSEAFVRHLSAVRS